MEDFNKMLEQLYKQEYKNLLHIAARMGCDRELALDMVQNTFMLALLYQQELSNHPHPAGWITIALENQIRNGRRQTERDVLSLEGVIDPPATEAETPLDALLPRQLSKEERDILLWRFGEQRDYREISDRLGISEAGCRKRLSRTLAKCRKYVKEDSRLAAEKKRQLKQKIP